MDQEVKNIENVEPKTEESVESKVENRVEESLNKISKSVETELKLIEKLGRDFQSKIKYDQQKEKTIDNLHRELQLYKSDLYKKMLKPIVTDLIFFIEQQQKQFKLLKKDPPSIEELFDRLDYVIEDLQDILYRQGVEPFNSETDIFNPKEQKVRKTIPTSDQELDKKVAEHISSGYLWDDKIFKSEYVSIYSYDPSLVMESKEDEKIEDIVDENLEKQPKDDEKSEKVENQLKDDEKSEKMEE